MKKTWKAAALAAVLAIAGCGGTNTNEIKIGAVITSTGGFAFVGQPYGNFYKAYVEYINANADDYADALNGKTLKPIIYDEGGDGNVGKTYIEKLINDDKVFALVGVLGTWNVVAAKTVLEEAKVPSVYFGTGTSAQMFEPAYGYQRYMMGVQPLYKTEGRLMYLRSLTEFEGVTKIGVVHTSSDDGASLKAGIEYQASLDTRANKPQIIYQQVTTTVASEMSQQIEAVKDCDVIIAAANQATFKGIYQAAQLNATSKGTPVLTTYVNIAPTAIPDEAVTTAGASDIYGAAWVVFNEVEGSSDEADRRLSDYEEFLAVVDANIGGHIPAAEKEAYKLSAYAMSSFIAIRMFMEGLKRVNAQEMELTAANYVMAMEQGKIPVAISGSVNYEGGQRIGLDSLSFVKYVKPATGTVAAAGSFVEEAPMKSIDDLFADLSTITA